MMARRKSLRSQLYRGARDLGNLEAAKQGPASLGKRYVRRAAYRKTNTGLGGLLPGLRAQWWEITSSLVGYRAPDRQRTRRTPRISIPASWY